MTAFRWLDSIAQRYKWLAHVVLWAGIFSFTWMSMDRQPPFAVLSVEPAAARPGQFVTIRAKVRRDAHRQCSAAFSRYVFDAAGARFDLGRSFASSETIADMEQRTPGAVRVTFLVPVSMESGPAALVTDLEYECNRAHRLWPIHTRTVLPFEVLSP